VIVGFVMFVSDVITAGSPFVLATSSPIVPFSPGGFPGQSSSVLDDGSSAVWPMDARPIRNPIPRTIAVTRNLMTVNLHINSRSDAHFEHAVITRAGDEPA
jgi:hypothetical protein